MFPLLTAMEQQRWDGLSVIYVCPLKALLNNLLPRLETYTGWLGRRVAVWHGDTTAVRRGSDPRRPPDVLLTTPESLESMLVSPSVDHRRLFADLRAVVVDEVHAFGGDDRGWHLLAVLERLTADRRPADSADRAVGDRRQPRRAAALAAGIGRRAAHRRRRRT